MEIYNQIGQNYNRTRNSDPRIVDRLINYLNCKSNSRIIDLGAGTGNYSFELAVQNYKVTALEPSETMINQRKNHKNIEWKKAFAENIPFENDYFDGAICTLAAHHFDSIQKSIEEIYRVLKFNSNFVMFTFDVNLIPQNSWLKEYFTPYLGSVENKMPDQITLSKLLYSIFKSEPIILKFMLPDDLKDGFFYSAWKYPEKYLDESFRNGISIFSIAEKDQVNKAIENLKSDLENGVWDKKYGYVRNIAEYEADYYFITIRKDRIK